MKVQELRQMTPKALQKLLNETRRKLAVTRFHVQTGQEQNTSNIRQQRKLVAQILTLLAETNKA